MDYKWDYKFWFTLAVTVYGVYLNRKQVALMNPQDREHLQTHMTGVRRHWPLLTMGLLVILVWTPYVYSHYQSTQKKNPELAEYDAPSAGLVLGWGQESGTSCYETVNGKAILSRQSNYKLAIGCFAYDGKEDVLDAPYLQVSNLYDIKDGAVTMRCSYQKYFLDYSRQMHSVGIMVALLNVPNGVQPNQFTTLRQARGLGVKILQISLAKIAP